MKLSNINLTVVSSQQGYKHESKRQYTKAQITPTLATIGSTAHTGRTTHPANSELNGDVINHYLLPYLKREDLRAFSISSKRNYYLVHQWMNNNQTQPPFKSYSSLLKFFIQPNDSKAHTLLDIKQANEPNSTPPPTVVKYTSTYLPLLNVFLAITADVWNSKRGDTGLGSNPMVENTCFDGVASELESVTTFF